MPHNFQICNLIRVYFLLSFDSLCLDVFIHKAHIYHICLTHLWIHPCLIDQWQSYNPKNIKSSHVLKQCYRQLWNCLSIKYHLPSKHLEMTLKDKMFIKLKPWEFRGLPWCKSEPVVHFVCFVTFCWGFLIPNVNRHFALFFLILKYVIGKFDKFLYPMDEPKFLTIG